MAPFASTGAEPLSRARASQAVPAVLLDLTAMGSYVLLVGVKAVASRETGGGVDDGHLGSIL